MPSSDISVEIRFNRLPQLMREMPQEVEDAIEGLAREGERMIKMSMRETEKQANGASAPGNPPAIDTGTLINSINVQNAGKFRRIIAAGTDYAYWLEFGTERMAARPFMTPVADQLRRMMGGWFARWFRDL